MRPAMFTGPMERQARAARVAESGIVCAASGAIGNAASGSSSTPMAVARARRRGTAVGFRGVGRRGVRR